MQKSPPVISVPESGYYPEFLSAEQSAEIYEYIVRNIDLSPTLVKLESGPVITLGESKCMFVDPELLDVSLFPAAHGRRVQWPPILLDLKRRLEEMTGKSFGVCVCIYYADGNSGVDFHTDLVSFGDISVIPSISLGAERIFAVRSKADPEDCREHLLENGSLFIMGPGFQDKYEHALPYDSSITQPRINLTFRQFGS